MSVDASPALDEQVNHGGHVSIAFRLLVRLIQQRTASGRAVACPVSIAFRLLVRLILNAMDAETAFSWFVASQLPFGFWFG